MTQSVGPRLKFTRFECLDGISSIFPNGFFGTSKIYSNSLFFDDRCDCNKLQHFQFIPACFNNLGLSFSREQISLELGTPFSVFSRAIAASERVFFEAYAKKRAQVSFDSIICESLIQLISISYCAFSTVSPREPIKTEFSSQELSSIDGILINR